MAGTFDEELTTIMHKFDVPQGLRDKLLAADCTQLWKFAEYVDDIGQWTSIMGALNPPVNDLGEIAKVQRAFKAAQACDLAGPHTYGVGGHGGSPGPQ